jgi:sec-independent protein translocase protein TatA
MVIESKSLRHDGARHGFGGLEGAAMGLGIPELLVILFIIILIFGASRLPEIGRGLGKGIRNFKDATRDSPSRDDR